MKQNDNINYTIRDFTINDTLAVNQVALLAFQQYRNYYNDWNNIKESISSMASLANYAELIVASCNENIIGAVAYVPSGIEKALFPKDWPVIRMLVVDPQYRGLGIGEQLIEAMFELPRVFYPLEQYNALLQYRHSVDKDHQNDS